jgi:hypothetical protein
MLENRDRGKEILCTKSNDPASDGNKQPTDELAFSVGAIAQSQVQAASPDGCEASTACSTFQGMHPVSLLQAQTSAYLITIIIITL